MAKIYTEDFPPQSFLDKFSDDLLLKRTGCDVLSEHGLPNEEEMKSHGMLIVGEHESAVWNTVLPNSWDELPSRSLSPPDSVLHEIDRLRKIGLFDRFEFRTGDTWGLHAVFGIYKQNRVLVALWRRGDSEIPGYGEICELATKLSQKAVAEDLRKYSWSRRGLSVAPFVLGLLLFLFMADFHGRVTPLVPHNSSAFPIIFLVSLFLMALGFLTFPIRTWRDQERLEMARLVLGTKT